MYSLDINFLKDRSERPVETGYVQPRAVQESPRPLYVGVAIAAFLPALALGLWWFLNTRNADLEQQITSLDSQLATVNALQSQESQINAQIAQLNGDTKALANVFDQIKPWSALLQDIQKRVPVGVQLAKIEQVEATPAPVVATPTPSPAASGASPTPAAAVPPPPPLTSKISISGQARSFSDVNDFLLTLQQSRFLKGEETRLVSATLIPNPATIQFAPDQSGNSGQVQVTLPQVVQYTIESSLTDLSASDLLQDLESNLAVGLASRIQSLRDKGVLTP